MVVQTDFCYHRVKYKDDGREIVSFMEFLTIHCTFPIINAWMSYNLAFEFIAVLSQYCPYTPLADAPDWRFCGSHPEAKSEQAYYYSLFLNPAKVCYLILVCENLINLAYYKDIIFGLVVILEFAGIFYNSYNSSLKEGVDTTRQNKLQVWILFMLSICVALEISVLILNFRSAFYLKAQEFRNREAQLRKRKDLAAKEPDSAKMPPHKLKTADVSFERQTKTTDFEDFKEYLHF